MANEEPAAEGTPPPGPENDNPAKPEAAAKPKAPAWAKDLRSLYDSVVEEPLPDSFMDLLSKLDGEPE